MRTPLGEILVREGMVSAEAVEEALKNQVIFGGRLGTNLVESGAIDLDTLARGLGLQLNAPPALQKHFDMIQPAVASLLPRKLAEKHQAVPLGIASRSPKTLAVAFIDPKVEAVDEVAFAVSVRVMATIGPELRVLHYLEKLYSIPRKTRFLRIETSPTPARKPAVAAVPAVERRQFLDASALDAAYQKNFSGSGLELGPAPVSAEPSAPRPPSATARLPPSPWMNEGAAPAPQVAAPQAPVSSAPVAATPVPTSEPGRPALGLKEALAAINEAGSRDEIGDALVDCLRSTFGCGLVMVVREGMALGWKGFADGVDAQSLETLAVPLSAPSVLKVAHERKAIFRGSPAAEASAVQTRLYKLLRCPPPQEVIVSPVMLKDRVVSILYAHAVQGAVLAPSALADVSALCAGATTGFARLIQNAKAKR